MRDHFKPQQPRGALRASPTMPADAGRAPQTTAKRVDHRKLRRTRRPPRSLPSLPDEHVLTEKELLERIPLDRQTIRRMVAEKRFPPPVFLTAAKRGWIWSRVLAWLADREQHPLRQREYFGRSDDLRPGPE